MKMSCIIQGLKEKEYIEFEKYTPPIHLNTFKTYKIKNLVGKKFKQELIETINKDDEYIICNIDKNTIIVTKTEDIDEWANKILIEEETFIKTGYPITKQLADYIRNKGKCSLFPTCYETGGYKIINNKIQNKRIKKEREIEKKAINFLKCLK